MHLLDSAIHIASLMLPIVVNPPDLVLSTTGYSQPMRLTKMRIVFWSRGPEVVGYTARYETICTHEWNDFVPGHEEAHTVDRIAVHRIPIRMDGDSCTQYLLPTA